MFLFAGKFELDSFPCALVVHCVVVQCDLVVLLHENAARHVNIKKLKIKGEVEIKLC